MRSRDERRLFGDARGHALPPRSPTTNPRPRRVPPRKPPNRRRFVLIYFGVVTGLCVAIGGWRGLLVAPVLILVAVASAWAGQRRRTIVQRLTDANDADFERMRREEVARRRRRDGRA